MLISFITVRPFPEFSREKISNLSLCIKLSLCSNGKILNFVYENNIRKLNNSRAGSAKTKELKIGIYSFCTGTYSIME
jgi:hypothetical protein